MEHIDFMLWTERKGNESMMARCLILLGMWVGSAIVGYLIGFGSAALL